MSTQQELLLVEVAADKDTCTSIENALQNAQFFHSVESHEPLKFRVIAHPVVVAMLLTFLETRASSISGKITMSDGTVYQLDSQGMSELKKATASKLGATPSVAPGQSGTQGGPNIVDIFMAALSNPEATGKLVKEVASALRGDPAVALEETKQVSRFTLTIMGLMGIVIIAASFLGYYGKIGGDTVGLVYGTVLGSSFGFLYKYLAAPEEGDS